MGDGFEARRMSTMVRSPECASARQLSVKHAVRESNLLAGQPEWLVSTSIRSEWDHVEDRALIHTLTGSAHGQ